MSREAMKQALEALQKIYIAPEHEEYIRVWWPACEQAIAALRERLAQPEQEPVAWRFRSGTWFNREVQWRYIDTLDGAEGLRGLQPLYTAPRQWQGLTDDVVFELADTNLYQGGKNFGVLAFAKAIEQALKEKNHG